MFLIICGGHQKVVCSICRVLSGIWPSAHGTCRMSSHYVAILIGTTGGGAMSNIRYVNYVRVAPRRWGARARGTGTWYVYVIRGT